MIIWLTGLSGSGKTTIAKELVKKYKNTIHLDGDELRAGINSDLSFSEEHRAENLRRAVELSKLIHKQGYNVVCSLIAPNKKERELISSTGIPTLRVYLSTKLEHCIERDPKGLYKQDLEAMTSYSYEPGGEDLILNTYLLNLDDCMEFITANIASNKMV